MDGYSGQLGIGVILFIVIIWVVIPLGIYVWYGFALSRLFPKLGEQGWKGWVPILNEMVILERGGVPGWSVVLYFLPIVSLYGLYLKATAMIRLGQRFGQGAGLVVLGFLLPPLWATLLASKAATPPSEHYGERIQGMMTPTNQGAPPAGMPADSFQQGQFQQGQFPQGQFQPDQFQQAPQQQQPPQQNAPFQQPPIQQNAPFQQPPMQQTPEFSGSPFAPPAPLTAPPAPPMPPAAEPVAPLVVPPPAVVRQPPTAPTPAEPMFSEPPPVPPVPPVPAEPVAAVQHLGIDPVVPQPPEADPVGQEAPLGGENPWAPHSSTNAAPGQMTTAAAGAPSSFDARANVAELPTIIPSQHAGMRDNEEEDDDLDRTVVVDRSPLVQWNLVTESGVILPLKSNSVLLGRKPASKDVSVELVAVPDETRTLSKNHARLDRNDEVWTITDLNSTNGVVLVAADGTETELPSGGSAVLSDQFILGNVSLILAFENGPS